MQSLIAAKNLETYLDFYRQGYFVIDAMSGVPNLVETIEADRQGHLSCARPSAPIAVFSADAEEPLWHLHPERSDQLQRWRPRAPSCR
jgi:hypothetical protein